jgi:hypothetical protein
MDTIQSILANDATPIIGTNIVMIVGSLLFIKEYRKVK